MPNHSYKTTNFIVQELVTPKTYEKLGEYAFKLFEEKALQSLDKLRDDYGKALKINDWSSGGKYSESGLRDIHTSTGASRSAHKFGYAFDLKHYDGSNIKPLQDFIKKVGASYGIKRVEAFSHTPSWVHVEFTSDFVESIYFFNP